MQQKNGRERWQLGIAWHTGQGKRKRKVKIGRKIAKHLEGEKLKEKQQKVTLAG